MIITGFQTGYIVNLQAQVPSAIISVSIRNWVSPFQFWLTSIVILTAGTIFRDVAGVSGSRIRYRQRYSLIIMSRHHRPTARVVPRRIRIA